MEFLFSQRGSQSELVPGEYDLFPFSLRLNYVEVPVMWHYKDWLAEGPGNTEYYKVSANVGLSYSRFISSRLKDELNALGHIALALVEVLLRQDRTHQLVDLSVVGQHFEFLKHHVVLILLLGHDEFVLYDFAILYRHKEPLELEGENVRVTIFDSFYFSDLGLALALNVLENFHLCNLSFINN